MADKKPAKASKASAKEAPVIVKKVKAYPFDALVEVGGQKKQVAVLFLNRDGLIARVDKVLVHVGEYHKLEFVLPVVGNGIMCESRVMKTYDKALDPKGLKVERMAEFRFGKLTEDHRNYISTFLSSIGQKK